MNIKLYSKEDQINAAAERMRSFLVLKGVSALAYDPAWLRVFSRALGHTPYMLEALDDCNVPVGWLPLGFVHTALFGRFLVSLPYLNVGGIQTDSPAAATGLIESACDLADSLKVKFLELRGEKEYAHPKLTFTRTEKYHLRLNLPDSEDALWKSIGCKARNQIRKGEKAGFTVQWGDSDALIRDFYDVFSLNMRDLGTPVYSINLFKQMRDVFNQPAFEQTYPLVQFAVVYSQDKQPAAAGVLTFGKKSEMSAPGVPVSVEVPSASCKRKYNADCANMFLYWQLLKRSIELGQNVFDFGRSTQDSSTFRFKTQWGAKPEPSFWQYYLRIADPNCMRPDKGGYGTAVKIWQKLPVWLTRLIGPDIVKGIP